MKLHEIFDEEDLLEKIFPNLTPPRPRLGKPLRKEKVNPSLSNPQQKGVLEHSSSLKKNESYGRSTETSMTR